MECFYCKKEIPTEERYTIYNGETACLDCVRKKMSGGTTGKCGTNNPPTHYAPHHDLCNEVAELLDKKRADYGSENIKKFGSQGVLVRISDKVERLINLSHKTGEANFESIEDTWKDIAGYAVLALIELREGR